MLFECDLGHWVDCETDPRHREFREAVHTVLRAISISQNLRASMLMKGGILLAIRYQSSRYTRDIDFSTNAHYRDFDQDTFVDELSAALITAGTQLDYDLDCRVQTVKLQPANIPNPLFPTLKLSIGYAPKYDRARHRQLLAHRAVHVVHVDYSFNENTLETENISLSDGGDLIVYSFSDVVAEKYRAILQQDVRNRTRRQDAYDLYELFQHFPELSEQRKPKILESLRSKSASRDLPVNADSLANPAILTRSRKAYPQLQSEIRGDLPPFDHVFGTVRKFYESLPW